MIVVLSGLGRTPLWTPHDEIFDPGPVGVRQAHFELACHALDAGYDETVVVVQDDIEPIPVRKHYGDITSYWPSSTRAVGWSRPGDHVCPKAFSATVRGWERLASDWSVEGKTCELWRPSFVYPPSRRSNEMGQLPSPSVTTDTHV